MRKKRILCLLLAAVLALTAFAGCKQDNSSSDGASSADDPPAQEQEVDTHEGQLQNPLTGLYDMLPGDSTLPVGVMICNDNSTKMQPGLDKADIYVETETEVGVSRIMAVFSNSTRIPETVGPVRSGRTPYLQITRALGWVCVHAGGSPKALAMVNESDVKHINVLKAGNTTWRDSAMKSANSNLYDHCLASSGELLTDYLTNKTDYGTDSGRSMAWNFAKEGAEATGSEAATLEIAISGHATGNSYFVYDSASGVYKKNKGTAEKHTAHCSADGTQLEVANIVILYAEKYVEQVEKYTRINFHLDKGSEAVLLSGGKSRNLTYSCSKTGLTLNETDGGIAELLPGKTYVYIISNEYKSKTVIGA